MSNLKDKNPEKYFLPRQIGKLIGKNLDSSDENVKGFLNMAGKKLRKIRGLGENVKLGSKQRHFF